MKCQKCEKEVFLPFRCPYCGGHFCSEHRLPENHECPQIDYARMPKEEARTMVVQRQEPFEYKVSYVPVKAKKRIYFSNTEIKHLTVAAFLVIGVGLSLGLFSNIFYANSSIDYTALVAFAGILTASFLTHETAHKIAAQKEGLWAEFRLTMVGAVLTLISVITPLFKIISPGAVMISGFGDLKSIGKTSIAGPLTNIALSTISLTLNFLFSHEPYALILAFAAFFNAWIAFFNLIPLGILDGFKVFRWDKRNWVLVFTASLILMIISYKLLNAQMF